MLKMLPSLLAVCLLQLIITEGAPASTSVCGQPRISSRIVGGQDAPEGGWSWQVSILYDFRPICGGALINEQWILTAASCVYGFNSIETYSVLLGARQLLNLSQNVQLYPLKKILIHPNYEGEAGCPGDIALLKLASPVRFTSRILPVCLPHSYDEFSNNPNCWIVGWGDTGNDEPLSYPLTLQEAKVPIISRRNCNNFYNAVPVQNMKEKNPVKPDMICTGYTQGSKAFCKGDGGGPLVCKVGKRWIQAGIVSWGVSCGKYFHPGVYTSVPFYSHWINNKIRTE